MAPLAGVGRRGSPRCLERQLARAFRRRSPGPRRGGRPSGSPAVRGASAYGRGCHGPAQRRPPRRVRGVTRSTQHRSPTAGDGCARSGETTEDQSGEAGAHQGATQKSHSCRESPAGAEDGRGGGAGRVEGGVAHGQARAAAARPKARPTANGSGGRLGGLLRAVVPRKTATRMAAPRLPQQHAGHRGLGDGVFAEAGRDGVKGGPGVADPGQGAQDAEEGEGAQQRADQLRTEVGCGFPSRIRPAMALPTVTAGLKWPPER